MPLRPLPGIISISHEPDMITLDDDPNEARAEMPCGHVISPASMRDFCRSKLEDGKYVFLCPYPGCGFEWQYFMVRHVACFSEEEMKEFDTKISQRYMMKTAGYQECPGCSVWCMRADEKSNNVRCLNCTKSGGKAFDFCWVCLQPWKGTLTTQCGNAGCDGTDTRLKYLMECPTKEVYGVTCPSVRACPNCSILIEHDSECKHMQCSSCDYEFCFICLTEWTKGNVFFGPCGSISTACTPAPVQTTITKIVSDNADASREMEQLMQMMILAARQPADDEDEHPRRRGPLGFLGRRRADATGGRDQPANRDERCTIM